jgi:hypothetical protein
MINFIKKHLLNKIIRESMSKYNKFNITGFIFFDAPIKYDKYNIDRINKLSVFSKNEIVPISWNLLSSEALLKIYKKIKENKIYIKDVD